MKKALKTPQHRAMMEELEPRLLFSADWVGVFAEGDEIAGKPTAIIADITRADGSGPGQVLEQESSQALRSSEASNEIAFIDARAADYPQLVNHLIETQARGGSIEVLVLDSELDGIEQITEALAERRDFTAVHIISHGADGALELGNLRLDEESLLKHGRNISGWHKALKADADLLLYGCDLASGAEGRALVDALGRLTGADVAASTDETGHALLGGDWDLEYQQGDIETDVAVSAEAQSGWQAVLATPTAADMPAGQVTQEHAGATVTDNAAAGTSNGESEDALLQALTTHDPASNRRELVFVDTSVEDYQTLLAGIDSNAEVLLLDANRDGMEQIAEALTGRTGIDAIHIVSHGDQAELRLGTARLTLDSMLGEHSDELALIGQALSDQADILVYGCNFGEGDIGEEAASRLADITGADVAASNDDTGHALLAGDWDLEYQVGTIETDLAFSIEVQQNWVFTLAPPFHSYEAPRSELPDQAYEIKSDQAWGQTFLYDSPGPTYAVDRIGLVLYRATDAPAQTLTVSIRSTWNGAAIASGTLSSTRMGVGEAWVNIALGSAAVLNDGATYYIRVDTDGIAKAYAGVDDTGTYANGDLIDKDGLPVAGKDMVFRLRLGNDPLAITNLRGDSLAYTEGDGAVVIEQGGDAIVTDPDSADFDTGTLTVSFEAGSDSAEDVLAIRDQGTGAGQIGVSGSNVAYGGTVIGTFAGGSGGANLVVTFNGNATPTAVTALLENITYENTDTANPTTGARTVRFVVTDGEGGNSGNHDTTVTVSRQNDTSVLAGIEGGDLAYTENGGAVAITSAMTLSDVDDTNIESATIQITGNYQNGQDVLAFVDTANITASWNVATGTLTLTGTEMLANYRTALRAVTYENTSDNPSGLTRTVSFTVNDGDDPSNIETRDITPTAVDAPTITGASSASVPENITSVLTVSATDEDGDTPTFAIAGGADDVATVETPALDEPSFDAKRSGLLASPSSTGGGFTANSDANETPPDSSSEDSDSANSTAIASTEDPIEAPADPERGSESSQPSILERVLQSIPVGKSEVAFHDSEASLRAFWNALDTARDMIENAGASEAARAELISRIETGASVAITAGFLTLGFRGESLLASLLCSLPAWRRFDPMAVLVMSPTDRQKLMKRIEEDDEEIRNVFALEDD